MSNDVTETEEVTKTSIPCDGGGEHPRVWLQIPADTGYVECPYCDKKFVQKK